MLADGNSRAEICEALGVKDKNQVTHWRKDARVDSRVRKIINARVVQITSKVDSVLAGRLQHSDKLTIKELLDIRKEYLGGALREQTERADDSTLTAAMDALERDPDLLSKMQNLLDGTPLEPRVPTDEELQELIRPDESEA